MLAISDNTLQKINVQTFQASFATETLSGNQTGKATYNNYVKTDWH